MTGQTHLRQFEDLTTQQLADMEAGARILTQLAYDITCPIIVGVPSAGERAANTASGFVIELGPDAFLVTAQHVVAHYRSLRKGVHNLKFQAGDLAFDPDPRVTYENAAADIILLSLSGLEVTGTGSVPYRPAGSFPPASPRVGDSIAFLGLPAFARSYPAPMEIHSGSMAAIVPVTTIGNGYFVCQFARERWLSFGSDPLPPVGSRLGGLSGGPVLLLGELSYPVIGLISEYQPTFELLRIATLSTIEVAAP